MTMDTKINLLSSLHDVGAYMQEQWNEGYSICPGWPIQLGWMYEVKMIKGDSTESKPVGRPKGGAKNDKA